MKSATLWLLTAVILVSSSVRSQTQSPSQTFPTFWAAFKKALAANDRQAVASMTKLPFALNGEELNREAFSRKLAQIFDKKTTACLLKATPKRDQEFYEVFCGEQILMFGKVDGRFKFIEISAND